MSVRNRLVRLAGLKDVGRLAVAAQKAAESYQVGDRLGIFNVLSSTDDDLLLGIDDRHLDVRVSVTKSRSGEYPSYVISTVVIVHNCLGDLYMIPVGRIHPLVEEHV
jgi:hypothetical protein